MPDTVHAKNDGWGVLTDQDCQCVDQVCSNCVQRDQFFRDLLAHGMPVQELLDQNTQTHKTAQWMQQRLQERRAATPPFSV